MSDNMRREKHDKKAAKGGNFLSALCGILGTALIVLVIAVLVPLAGARIAGYQLYHITSGSMEPAVPVGSLAIVKPCDPVELTEGDIIAYYTSDSVVIHRVFLNQPEKGSLITKGDANEISDPRPVRYDNVAGIVTRHYDRLGVVLGVIGSMKGKVCLIMLILAGGLLQTAGRRLKN